MAVGAHSWCHLPRAGIAPKAASWQAQEPLPLALTRPVCLSSCCRALGSALPAQAHSSSCTQCELWMPSVVEVHTQDVLFVLS